MKTKVKVFMNGLNPKESEADFNNRINDFLDSSNIEVVNIHTNSNSYGWMVIISYKISY